MKPEITRCPTCGRKKRRGNPANARYWLLLHMASDKLKPEGNAYTPEQFHIYYKSRFLGCDEFVMPNGKTMQIPRSTAELSTSEFADYMMQVEMDLNERGVWLDSIED